MKNLIGIIMIFSLITSCQKEDLPPDIQVNILTDDIIIEGQNNIVKIQLSKINNLESSIECYIDFGENLGEHNSIFRDSTDNLENVAINNVYRDVKKVNLTSSDNSKEIELIGAENDWYGGDRDIKLYVYNKDNLSYPLDSAMVYYKENEHKPKIGFLYGWEGDSIKYYTVFKNQINPVALTIGTDSKLQFPQSVKLNYTGNAELNIDYKLKESVVLERNVYSSSYKIFHLLELLTQPYGRNVGQNINIEILQTEDYDKPDDISPESEFHSKVRVNIFDYKDK